MTRTAWFLIGLMTLAQPSPGQGQALDLNAAVDSITVQLAEQVGGAGSLRVATSELLDSAGSPNALGRFIADRLAASLTTRAEFQVVGRRQLERALDERGLEIADLVEPDKAAEVCALLNCDAVLVGRISEVGDDVEVTIRMVEDARALEEITALLRKNAVVEDLLRRGQLTGTEPPGPEADPDAPGAAEWPSITRSRIEVTLTACPYSEPEPKQYRGTLLHCNLVVTNNSNRQDWISVFEVGSYASDAEGVQVPLDKIYDIGPLMQDRFYSYSVMLPRSGRPIILVLKFSGSAELGDLTSVVIRAQVGSSVPAELEFKRVRQ